MNQRTEKNRGLSLHAIKLLQKTLQLTKTMNQQGLNLIDALNVLSGFEIKQHRLVFCLIGLNSVKIMHLCVSGEYGLFHSPGILWLRGGKDKATAFRTAQNAPVLVGWARSDSLCNTFWEPQA